MSGVRRSSRIKALPPQNFAGEAVQDEDEAISTSMSRKRGRDTANEDSDWRRPRKKKTKTKGDVGKLSLLPTMPLDILFEICAYLPPKSLVALIDVNKAFREILVGPVWTTLRKEFEAPDPPPGLNTSEVDWMRLLFGDMSLTQFCGAKRVTANWVLRKKICKKCVPTQGVSTRGFVKVYGPELDKTSRDLVLSLVWPTRSDGACCFPFEQIDKVFEGLRISRGKGQEEADKYVAERKAYLVELREHVRLCEEWVKAETMKRFKDSRQIIQERFNGVKARLLTMGFTEQDAERVEYLDCVYRETPLTDRSWNMIKSEVVRRIYHYKTRHMFYTDPPALRARCDIISRLYTTFLKTLTPIERRGFPNVRMVYLLPAVNRILVRDEAEHLTEHDFQEVMAADELTSAFGELLQKNRTYLWQKLDMTFQRSPEPDVFSLAAVELYCCSCDAYPGTLKDAFQHVYGTSCRSNYSLETKLFGLKGGQHSAASSLVEVSGLDPLRASADEMDEKGSWYRCRVCYADDAFIGTWRECVNHFHICYYLPPATVVVLADVNRAFRETLSAPSAVSIWTAMRKKMDAPEPPAGDVSEVEWMRLLSGKKCQHCLAKSSKIDFILRERLCNGCYQCISGQKFRSHFPNADKKVVLDLVIPTNIGNNLTNYYSLDDIEGVIAELKACKGKKQVEQYIAQRKVDIQDVLQHIQVCKDWAKGEAQRRAKDANERFEVIESRLLAMGFVQGDIQVISWLSVVKRDAPFTERSWSMMKPEVLDSIYAARTFDFFKTVAPFFQQRCEVVQRLYAQSKQTRIPGEWRDYPSIGTIFILPSVNQILVRLETENATEEDFRAALEGPNQDWRPLEIGIQESVQKEKREHPTFLSPDMIDLATTLCHCARCQSYTGPYRDVIRHLFGQSCRVGILQSKMHWNFGNLRNRLRPERSVVAKALVKVSGLDPKMTTADDMDEKALYYSCRICQLGSRGREFTGTWRECLSHFHGTVSQSGHRYSFSLVASLQGNLFEVVDAAKTDDRLCWCCSRCNAHVEHSVSKAAVIEYLNTEHKVYKPRIPQHFFYVEEVQ
uniref:F-box domain-containing protein n=1 Tax=Moniliophthora roreri TaxID=221103 RepID=A0A0W0F725_MONRR